MSRIFHDRERWLLQALTPSLQCVRMVVKIFPWRIMVPAGVFVVAFADSIRKLDDVFLVNISDEATVLSTVGTADLAAVTVFLKMKTILTHGRADYRCLYSALLHFGLY